MFRELKRSIERGLFYIIPRVYNLPECFYIRWLDNEYIIRKSNGGFGNG